MSQPNNPEPWLRGTLTDIDPVRRAVLHALELAVEDFHRWHDPLSEEQLNGRSFGLPSVGFHLIHTARSLDRLLTYAEGLQLSDAQLALLKTEMNPLSRQNIATEFRNGISSAAGRIRQITPASFAEQRAVGRKQLPTTVAGLIIHCADHTQRHMGQAVTTAKLLTYDSR